MLHHHKNLKSSKHRDVFTRSCYQNRCWNFVTARSNNLVTLEAVLVSGCEKKSRLFRFSAFQSEAGFAALHSEIRYNNYKTHPRGLSGLLNDSLHFPQLHAVHFLAYFPSEDQLFSPFQCLRTESNFWFGGVFVRESFLWTFVYKEVPFCETHQFLMRQQEPQIVQELSASLRYRWNATPHSSCIRQVWYHHTWPTYASWILKLPKKMLARLALALKKTPRPSRVFSLPLWVKLQAIVFAKTSPT